METPRTLKTFDDAGCEVDYDAKKVMFPRELVLECLNLCPSSFRVEARDPKNDLVVDGNRTYVQPGPGMKYLDLDTFQPRDATRREFHDAVTIYDALPNLHLLHPNSPNTSFEGVPSVMQSIETYVARARNSTKAQFLALEHGDWVFKIEIAKVIGAKGLSGMVATPPLSYNGEYISGLITVVQEGFPCTFSSGAIWGASAPATIAGQLVSASVENVGLIVLTQLLRPGHPVSVKLFTMPQNMRNGAPFFGNITIALSNMAYHQVWRRYNIPTTGIEPAIPNSKCMDFQSGYEKGMLALASAISGAYMLWIHSTVYGELTAHPIQAIMDDDIAGMIGRFLEGVEVNDETLAVDLIEMIGSGPDFYLTKEHTRKWWRKEQFIPAVADTTTLQEWLKTGKKTNVDLAKEKMEQVLATYKVSVPLTPSQEEDIEKILREARDHYRKTGMISDEDWAEYLKDLKSPKYPYG